MRDDLPENYRFRISSTSEYAKVKLQKKYAICWLTIGDRWIDLDLVGRATYPDALENKIRDSKIALWATEKKSLLLEKQVRSHADKTQHNERSFE